MPFDPPPIVIEQISASAELPQSPKLPEDRPGLAVRISPARHVGTNTFAVLGTVNLTKRQSLLYGPDARQVLRLVAFDPRTGRIFHASVAGPHDPALGPVNKFTPPEPPRTPTGAVLPSGFGFNFNKDLLSSLQLPGEAARYTVHAWIEDLVSNPQVVEVPEDKVRFPAKPFFPDASISSPLNIRTVDLSPARQKGMIAVRGAPPAENPDLRIGRVFGSIGSEVLPAVPPGVEGAPKYLAILAQTALDRRIAVRTVRLPAAVFDETGCGEFDFEATDLFPPDTKRQPVFVVVLSGQKASEAVTLVPPGWRD